MANISEKELSWDVLGYYLPLPASFIYDDPMLDNRAWVEQLNEEKELAGTLYMISSNDEGQPMYFFLFGMSVFYLPFFLIAQVLAMTFGFPVDGFSSPYQYTLAIGAICYTIIGLIYFRKILKHYLPDKVVAIVLVLTVFATNYVHHLTLKNLETTNMLFMLVSILIWYTIKWHRVQKLKFLMIIGASIALIALVKPSEIVIGLVPLLWNIDSREAFRQKLNLLVSNWKQIVITAGLCLLIISPQLIYWQLKTGSFVYDSYKNPGVGLDFLRPYILESLFSYRKGWLIYTPIMLFYLIGFVALYKENRKIFLALSAYFICTFYIICSWSEWWYGAGFSNRPLITTYPVLAIGFGYLLTRLSKMKRTYTYPIALIFIACFALNQFQWWQLRNFILDPYRTTKEYYWATFLRTSVSDEDRALLSINRDFTGIMKFENRADYTKKLLFQEDFEASSYEGAIKDSTGNTFLRLAEDQSYALTQEIAFAQLTQKEHVWVVVNAQLRFDPEFDNSLPCMVMTMERKEGVYHYFAPEIVPESNNGDWSNYQFEYLSPEIRHPSDRLKIYIWKRGNRTFDVDNFVVEYFEEKVE